jgi:flavin reductase (DIM6/NTAB) family NADH-FMN oxidoreductase RutF
MHSLLSGTDGTFGISVLTDEQGGIADHFARRPWAVAPEMPTRRHSGTPVVAGALVWLICRKWAAYEGGDHTIFVGEVLDHGSDTDGGRAPLLHHNSTYHRLGTPMGAAALPADATAEGE